MLRHQEGNNVLAAGAVGLRSWQRPARFRNLWVKTAGRTEAIPFVAVDPGPPNRLSAVDLPPIAFVTRHPLSRPNSISCDIWQSQPRQPGCSIRVLDPARPEQPARTLFADPAGCIYDLNLSFGARTLYFSYRRGGEEHWHLWQIQSDGQGLAQLTDGPHHDLSPMPLPGGGLIFVSTRRGGYTLCQPGPASNLHRLSADGREIQCVSMNTLADFSPQMLPDGRVLFTRWEYVDRDLTYRQHDLETGEMLPAEKLKGKPLVHFYWLLRTPSAVNQPLSTGSHASRLTELVEGGHSEPFIPREDPQISPG